MIVVALCAMGCASVESQKTASGSTAPANAAIARTTAVYYDFGDILLPAQLAVNESESFVFATDGLTAGMLSLKGRLTAKSLIRFFCNKMPVDGWQMINKFTGQRNMMLFVKEARYCTIVIAEGQLKTIVEIWVAPSMIGTPAGKHR
jgi:hypothetical protein